MPYAYRSPGPYQASVEIRMRGGRLTLPKIFGPVVQVFSPSSPSPVTTATSAPISPSPPSYTPSATATATVESITATPPGSGTNVASPTATRPPRERHTATPTSVPSNGGSASEKTWWVFYVISAGLAAAALFGIPKLIKPTFHLHADWDAPQKPPENLVINYGFYFHSNVSAGEVRLQTDGARLILRRRTQ
jgi:hypothetical protein